MAKEYTRHHSIEENRVENVLFNPSMEGTRPPYDNAGGTVANRIILYASANFSTGQSIVNGSTNSNGGTAFWQARFSSRSPNSKIRLFCRIRSQDIDDADFTSFVVMLGYHAASGVGTTNLRECAVRLYSNGGVTNQVQYYTEPATWVNIPIIPWTCVNFDVKRWIEIEIIVDMLTGIYQQIRVAETIADLSNSGNTVNISGSAETGMYTYSEELTLLNTGSQETLLTDEILIEELT